MLTQAHNPSTLIGINMRYKIVFTYNDGTLILRCPECLDSFNGGMTPQDRTHTEAMHESICHPKLIIHQLSLGVVKNMGDRFISLSHSFRKEERGANYKHERQTNTNPHSRW